MPKNKKYRSSDWFNSKSHRRDTFVHRGWMRNQGHPNHLFDGRPVIGICNTWSELTPCNGHFRDIAEYVRRGVYEAGGFPLEFPVFSASESNLRPTAMLFRNLASMDVEEAIRGNPMDGVVLLMGCDKTTPSLLMSVTDVCSFKNLFILYLLTICLSSVSLISTTSPGSSNLMSISLYQIFEMHDASRSNSERVHTEHRILGYRDFGLQRYQNQILKPGHFVWSTS